MATLLLKSDLKDDAPIIGYVNCRTTGRDVIKRWTKSGRIHPFFESMDDLVNIPESTWMNIYENSIHPPCWRESRAAADGEADWRACDGGPVRIAIIERKPSGEFITTAVEK